MKQINIDLYTKNLLALINAGNSAGGGFGSWLLKPDVSELLICLANNNIKLNPVYIRPKDEVDHS
ncbi:hypothetical protein UFOVP760_18 [uncultured Caudovirales phage]|uniref:Uncharacterized protein n=1 Tax=uncultured Caudovirales phage TaxID=2100421 RepID=A0A6J7X6K6_9CAUD|nr:hypothetical protein UFOVP760_18 [uncultured Caudovirales phage]